MYERYVGSPEWEIQLQLRLIPTLSMMGREVGIDRCIIYAYVYIYILCAHTNLGRGYTTNTVICCLQMASLYQDFVVYFLRHCKDLTLVCDLQL